MLTTLSNLQSLYTHSELRQQNTEAMDFEL